MLDTIYKTVQTLANKEQLGYIKPMDFNLYVNAVCSKLFNRAFSELKTNVRKANWFLDGKNYADYSEFLQQAIEHYTVPSTNVTISNGSFSLPQDCVFILDVYNGTTPIEKTDYQDFRLLKRNNYVAPSECSPICSKAGTSIEVLPTSITVGTISYVRQPKTAKWTYEEVDGKPMYDPTKSDFQEVDIPYTFKDEMIMLVYEMASRTLRETTQQQLVNQDQQQELQIQNNQ